MKSRLRQSARPLLLFSIAALLSACAEKPQPVAKIVQPPPPAPPKPKPALVIKSLHPTLTSRKGLVAAHIDFVNGTGRTLEYVTFKTTAYTEDGRLVRSKKTGRKNAWLRVAGPFPPGQSSGDKLWDKVWNNRKMNCFRIDGAELIDTQGVVEYYKADRIALLPAATPKGSCKNSS